MSEGQVAEKPAEERRTGADRRSGTDRRQGDRREGDRRGGFGGVGRKGNGFFENPLLVVGTVLFGVLVGIAIMKVTSAPSQSAPVTQTNLPSGGIDVIVKPAPQ